MARQTFPDSTIFAYSDAAEIRLPYIDRWSIGYQSGAGQEPPAAGVHNYEFNRSDQQHQHTEQNGVPRWDARTSYTLGGWALGSDHMLYRSKVAGNVGNDPTQGNGTYWRSIASITAEKTWPVSSAIMRATNPGLPENQGGLGFGSWTQVGGRSIIGAGIYTDTNGERREFNVGNTYGEYSHKLSVNELPSHSHDTGNYRKIDLATRFGTSSSGVNREGAELSLTGLGFNLPKGNTGANGGDARHNNLPPTFAVNIWFRIS